MIHSDTKKTRVTEILLFCFVDDNGDVCVVISVDIVVGRSLLYEIELEGIA